MSVSVAASPETETTSLPENSPEKQNRETIKLRGFETKEKKFRRYIIGQDHAVRAFAKLLMKIKSGSRLVKIGPIDVKFLAGPSGTGKTEIIYALAAILLESAGEKNPRETAEKKVFKLNGAEYPYEHDIAKLMGAPPGYVGYQSDANNAVTGIGLSPASTDSYKIKYKDNAGLEQKLLIVLIDEAEKAHAALHRLFLSPMEKGQMRLGNNIQLDFSNALIFFTSNVGTHEVETSQRKKIGLIQPNTEKESKKIIKEAFRKTFPPEFRSRVKDLIIFDGISKEMARKITELKLQDMENKILESGLNIRIRITESAREWIASKGIGHAEGARFLQKLIEQKIWDPLTVFSDPKELDWQIVTIDPIDEENLGLFKAKVEPAAIWLPKLQEKALSFYLSNGLPELAEELMGSIAINEKLADEIQEHVANGFVNGLILPNHALQKKHGNQIFQAMVEKPSPILKDKQQYLFPDTFSKEIFKDYQVLIGSSPPDQPARPESCYLLLYRGFMDPTTLGVDRPALKLEFSANGWQSFSATEYLIIQRFEAEKRGDHTFDQWGRAEEKFKTGNSWLLDYSWPDDAKKSAYFGWAPEAQKAEIEITSNNVYTNVGAHPIIIIPLNILKSTEKK